MLKGKKPESSMFRLLRIISDGGIKLLRPVNVQYVEGILFSEEENMGSFMAVPTIPNAITA